MPAVVVRRYGGPEVLQFESLPRPIPQRDQLLIEIAATGVNFAEAERRRGSYLPPPLPWIPGREAAGRVVGLGPDGDPRRLGARVCFWGGDAQVSGTYAGWCVVDPTIVVEVDPALDLRLAAALPLQGLTAYALIHHAARIQPGERVLIHAAAGGVGGLAVQLCRRLGAEVFGTASSEAKRSAIAHRGAQPLSYQDDLRSLAVDVVLDSVGKETARISLAALRPYGRLIFYGEASGAPEPVEIESLYDRSLQVGAFGLDLSRHGTLPQVALRELMALVVQGELTVPIAESIPLNQAARAHQLLESRQVSGKLLLVPS
jgi:NADPH2:quinone reductase